MNKRGTSIDTPLEFGKLVYMVKNFNLKLAKNILESCHNIKIVLKYTCIRF